MSNAFSHRANRLAGILLMLVIEICANAQSHAIDEKFTNFSNQHLVEKIFVHTDQSLYAAGEIVWFKVYCTGDSNHLLDLSKVAYLEVLNQTQQPVLQTKISLLNGLGDGSLALPSNLPAGNYTLRCYTNWMKNFDPAFYYHQSLSIVNVLQADTALTAAPSGDNDIQFFPEGGDLVAGLPGKVAFKIVDQQGKGVAGKGVLTDENNDTIIRFAPLVFGIGNFIFTPQKEHTYKATVTTTGGNVFTKPLPAALPSGFALHLSDLDASYVQINITTNTANNTAYLFIHAGQHIQIARQLTLINGRVSMEVERSSLAEGISHITLFDQNDQPVCERLYFNPPTRKLSITMQTDQASYQPRSKISLTLGTADMQKPLSANLSVAVVWLDLMSLQHPDIYSYLWLSSDLQGNIESPEYYCQSTGLNLAAATDNLLLTHGWRRFAWKDVLARQTPPLTFLPEYQGHIVSGKVVNRATDETVAGIPAFLSIPGRHFQLYPAISSATGTVYFNTKGYSGSKLMIGLVNTTDPGKYRLDLDNPFSEKYAGFTPVASAQSVPASVLLQRSINLQVQHVYHSSRIDRYAALTTDSANFYGKPDASYLLEDYTRFPTMEEVLREYVREILVRKKRDRFYLMMADKDEHGNPLIKEPVILLDGVPQFDSGNHIIHFDPLLVEKLETINEVYHLGSARFTGIASFFTYKGDLQSFQLDTATTVLDYEALQMRRQFYAPTYANKEDYHSTLPDFRTLLYWAPNVAIDDTGKRQLQFYSSDLPGKYAVVVQGIAADGNAGSATYTFDVVKQQAKQ